MRVDLRDLIIGRRASRADRPYGLIGDGGVLRVHALRHAAGKLARTDMQRAAVQPLVFRLADADDRRQASAPRGFCFRGDHRVRLATVSYTHLRAHETGRNLVCRLLLEKKKTTTK